jgi:hypothetical protein
VTVLDAPGARAYRGCSGTHAGVARATPARLHPEAQTLCRSKEQESTMARKKKNKALNAENADTAEKAEKAEKAETRLEQVSSAEALSADIKRRLDHMKVCLDDGGRPTMSEYRDMLKDLKTLRRRILGDDDGPPAS